MKEATMSAVLLKELDHVASQISSDPTKRLLAERYLRYLASTFDFVSTKDAKKLLIMDDLDLCLTLNDVLVKSQSERMQEESIAKKIKQHSDAKTKIRKVRKFHNDLKSCGGFHTSKELELLLGISRAAITNRKDRNALFGVKVGGKVYFPKFQFNESMEITQSFKVVLELLKGKDLIASFYFLLEQVTNHQNEKKPIYDVLKDPSQKRYIFANIEKRARRLHSL